MHQHLIGVNADAKRQLVHASAFTLKAGESIIYVVVSYEAMVDAQKPVASSLHEAHVAPTFCREPQMVAIPPGIFRRNSGRDGRVDEPPYPPQLLPHDVLLKSELTGISDVLPLATATGAEVWTRCVNAIRRRLENFHNAPHRHACTTAQQLDGYGLAGYSVFGKNNARTIVGKRASLEGDIVKLDSDTFGRVEPVFSLLSGHDDSTISLSA